MKWERFPSEGVESSPVSEPEFQPVSRLVAIAVISGSTGLGAFLIAVGRIMLDM